jgi:hypothetical protein
VANVAVALVPDLLPLWMRVEMIAIALLMAGGVLLVVRAARPGAAGDDPDRRSSS